MIAFGGITFATMKILAARWALVFYQRLSAIRIICIITANTIAVMNGAMVYCAANTVQALSSTRLHGHGVNKLY